MFSVDLLSGWKASLREEGEAQMYQTHCSEQHFQQTHLPFPLSKDP